MLNPINKTIELADGRTTVSYTHLWNVNVNMPAQLRLYRVQSALGSEDWYLL